MKKKFLLVGIVLALVATLLIPASVLAAKPAEVEASGVITAISPGTVFPAGNSGRWIVAERDLDGILLDGDITGEFTMTYRANVELATQAGNLHGTMEVGGCVLQVNGKIAPLEMVPTPLGVYLPKLTIAGNWTIIDGGKGQGEFEAWVIFIPTPEGHVDTIVASAITLNGK